MEDIIEVLGLLLQFGQWLYTNGVFGAVGGFCYTIVMFIPNYLIHILQRFVRLCSFFHFTSVVKEGSVGLVYRNGALLRTSLEPGVHFSLPFIDEVVQVSTSVKTNQITNVECGTGGIEISFPSIEIVSYLNKENAYEIVRDQTVEYDQLWIDR